jgi:xanthine dehydrogenase accessory factor
VTCITGEFDEVGTAVSPENGICLVMTHDHQLDQAALEWAVKRGFAFVGGVGSRAKAERTRQRLEAKGFPEADRQRIRMPLGVDIGARSPEEIAIAIAAELIGWRRSVR